MDFEGFRDRFNEYRDLADREAEETKVSHLALQRLSEFYEMLDPKQRDMAHQVIAEWLLSPDVGTRFHAMHLIDEFTIRSTASTLERLIHDRALNTDPGAAWETERVTKLLAKLDT